MARFRKLDEDEVRERRHALSDQARTGGLLIPEAVLQMRTAVGLTQEEFGRLFGMTKRQISEIEIGRSNPSARTLMKIGRLFGFQLAFVAKPPAAG